jgi:hypothetical protein
MFQLQLLFLLHCDEWDRVVALPRHKFVTGATLLQLNPSWERESSNVLPFSLFVLHPHKGCFPINVARINKTWTIINQQLFFPVFVLWKTGGI